MRRAAWGMVCVALVLAACGGSDQETRETSAPADVVRAPGVELDLPPELGVEVTVAVGDAGSDPDSEAFERVHALYELGPAGTEFASPITVAADVPRDAPLAALVLRSDDGTWSAPSNQARSSDGSTITASLDHFSSLFVLTWSTDLAPGSSAVGEQIPVPGEVVALVSGSSRGVARVFAVDGSEPGLSFQSDGFSCEQPGDWPLGVSVVVPLGGLPGLEAVPAVGSGTWACVSGTTTTLPTVTTITTTTLGPPTVVDSIAVFPDGLEFEVGDDLWYLYEWNGFLVAVRPPYDGGYDCDMYGDSVTNFRTGTCSSALTLRTIGFDATIDAPPLYYEIGTWIDDEQGMIEEAFGANDAIGDVEIAIVGAEATGVFQLLRIIDDDTLPLIAGPISLAPGDVPSIPLSALVRPVALNIGDPPVFEIDADLRNGLTEVVDRETMFQLLDEL